MSPPTLTHSKFNLKSLFICLLFILMTSIRNHCHLLFPFLTLTRTWQPARSLTSTLNAFVVYPDSQPSCPPDVQPTSPMCYMVLLCICYYDSNRTVARGRTIYVLISESYVMCLLFGLLLFSSCVFCVIDRDLSHKLFYLSSFIAKN